MNRVLCLASVLMVPMIVMAQLPTVKVSVLGGGRYPPGAQVSVQLALMNGNQTWTLPSDDKNLKVSYYACTTSGTEAPTALDLAEAYCGESQHPQIAHGGPSSILPPQKTGNFVFPKKIPLPALNAQNPGVKVWIIAFAEFNGPTTNGVATYNAFGTLELTRICKAGSIQQETSCTYFTPGALARWKTISGHAAQVPPPTE